MGPLSSLTYVRLKRTVRFFFFFIDSRGRDRPWQMLPVMDDEVILKMIISGLCLWDRKLYIDYITLLREPKCNWTGHTVIWCWLNLCYNSNWWNFIRAYVSSTTSFLQQNVENYLRYKNDPWTNHMRIFIFQTWPWTPAVWQVRDMFPSIFLVFEVKKEEIY